LVSEHEIARPEFWIDREYVRNFLILAEEMKHYFSTHVNDKRDLRLSTIEVSEPPYDGAGETKLLHTMLKPTIPMMMWIPI
jgi:hypothetical protein